MLPHGAHAWPRRHTHILASRMPSSSCRHLNSDWSATFRRSWGLWRFVPAESGVSKPKGACLHVEEAFEFLPSCLAPLLWMMLLNVEALLTRKFHSSWKVCCLPLRWCGLEHCLAFHLPCLWHGSVNAVSLQVMFFSIMGILLELFHLQICFCPISTCQSATCLKLRNDSWENWNRQQF